ncbi:multiheme c-type cytochrome [Halorhodospira halophila]|uniref:Outer membrane cytochrome MtrC/MtrF-like domain-containing protein n=1 Tax=Halorhodospira halophila (strain DSM 244 / SL1) TaxID=349124 RepID=A1WZN0_HALHL|nr:hypothetical protein [Halorhodospira halophila]ABM63142.1 hypothetical protein Hhal_2379 [Halorhodospira halophila SL1]MBK1729321.1 hypothetical protein [Halorhodospira halophila]
MTETIATQRSRYGRRGLVTSCAIAAVLALSACDRDETTEIVEEGGDGGTAAATSFHEGEWADIEDLDPRSEECADCHEPGEDPQPINEVHDLAQGSTRDQIPGGEDENLIERVEFEDNDGPELTISLSQDLSDRQAGDFTVTFARLSPRLRASEDDDPAGEIDENEIGHDWQNYFNIPHRADSVPFRAGDADTAVLYPAPEPVTAGVEMVDGETLRVDLEDQELTNWEWRENEQVSITASGVDETLTIERGAFTEISDHGGLGQHINCTDETNTEDGIHTQEVICWWPDGTALPQGVFVTEDDQFVVEFDARHTHRLGLEVSGVTAYNETYDFVPEPVANYAWIEGKVENAAIIDPGAYDPVDMMHQTTDRDDVPAVRNVVTTESCNSCHNGFSQHGGNRSEVEQCVTCHNPGHIYAASGRSGDFKQFVHRIHRGSDLPAYGVDGDAEVDLLAAAPAASDWSTVRFPQGPSPGQDGIWNTDAREGVAERTDFDKGITNCVKCHQGEDSAALLDHLAEEDFGLEEGYVADRLDTAEVTAQGDNWHDVFNVQACRSCHDDQYWHVNDSSEPVEALWGADYLDVGTDWLESHRHGEEDTTYAPHETCSSGCHAAGASKPLSDWINEDLETHVGVGPAGSLAPLRAYDPLDGDDVDDDPHLLSSHLQGLRHAMVADRFEVVIEGLNGGPPEVTEDGFEAVVYVEDAANGNLWDQDLDLSVFFAWMDEGFKDYTHSTSDHRQPGAPTASVSIATDEGGEPAGTGVGVVEELGGGEFRVELGWEEITGYSAADFDFTDSGAVATAVAEGTITRDIEDGNGGILDTRELRLTSQAEDFAFDGSPLQEWEIQPGSTPARAATDGRAQLVQFEVNDENVPLDQQNQGVLGCRSCHMQLSVHGDNRTNNPQVCVTCHTPNMTDTAWPDRSQFEGSPFGADQKALYDELKMPGEHDGKFEEATDFKRLIHAVHTSGRAGGGFRQEPLQVRDEFRNKTSFPAGEDSCWSCHFPAAVSLEAMGDGVIGSTALTGDWYGIHYFISDAEIHDIGAHRKMSPVSAACTSCHDGGIERPGGASDDGDVLGWHIWERGGIAPRLAPQGHEATDLNLRNYSEYPLEVPQE